MVCSCVAFNCKNRQGQLDITGKKLQFHRFPLKISNRTKQWMAAVRRKNWHPTKFSKLCSAHFKESDYLDRPGTERRYLKESAVPSVFSFPPRMIKSPKPRRTIVRHIEVNPPTSTPESEVEPISLKAELPWCIESLTITGPSTPQKKERLPVSSRSTTESKVEPISSMAELPQCIGSPSPTGHSIFEKNERLNLSPTKLLQLLKASRKQTKILQQRLARRNKRLDHLKQLVLSLKKKAQQNTQEVQQNILDLD